MSLNDIYDILPTSERTLLRHWRNGQYKGYPFTIKNDLGAACDWRIAVDGRTIGMVRYYRGRKLVAHGYAERAA